MSEEGGKVLQLQTKQQAQLSQQPHKARVQLDEEVREPDQLRESARPQTHASFAVRPPAAARQERGRRRAVVSRRGPLVRGPRTALVALEFCFCEILDPGCEFAEGGGEEGEGLHCEALAVRRECHEGVDAAAAAGCWVGNPEDVGGGVAGQGIAKEDRSARGRGARGAGGEGAVDEGGGKR